MSGKLKREDNTIQSFCERLRTIQNSDVVIEERPDRQNKGQGGCDAIITIDGKKHALEHTTIDSYKGQRKDTAIFNKVIVPLQDYIRTNVRDSWVEICIPSNAISKGYDWGCFERVLKSECLATIRKMPFGHNSKEYHFNGVPFPVTITRHKDLISPDCYVMREAPSMRFKELENNILESLKRKSIQLKPYKDRGFTTILLLDSDDFSLMNHHNFAMAFGHAAKNFDLLNFDKIFYTETYRHPSWIFPLKLENRIFPNLKAEFVNYFISQYTLTYGKNELF